MATKKKTEPLAIVQMDPRSLKDYPRNSKIHSQSQIDGLAKNFKELGFDVPIVVDENHVILKGHGRKQAAIQAGLATVPCIVHAGLTEDQKIAVRLSDNKLSESPWDQDFLKIDLQYLQMSEDEIDITLTGFEQEEIDRLLNTDETDFQEAQVFGFGQGGEQNSGGFNIPSGNKDINEDELSKTKHRCPDCGFEW